MLLHGESNKYHTKLAIRYMFLKLQILTLKHVDVYTSICRVRRHTPKYSTMRVINPIN